ncbi:tetratricopeptide repeat protein [Aestuariivirga sp.]|uniref:tetratricopeptide repeat protein n=1 Tax=Aestuariivirga sp. TaxID=2650926 RepID=UPI0039E30446
MALRLLSCVPRVIFAVVFAGLIAISAMAQDAMPLEGLSFAKKMKLAKAGDDTAQLAVGIHYELGIEAKKDAQQAARWYRESTLKGNIEAQYRLARLISRGAKGLTPDKIAAATLLQAGAEKGHAPSQNEFGLRLQNGDGIDADNEKAAFWFQKAADQDYAPAKVNLGLLYVRGQGVVRDYKLALKLFSEAADQGDAWALNNLGSLYEMGWGTTKDVVKAREFYRAAIAKGNQMAQANLSRLDGMQANAGQAGAPAPAQTQGN